MKPMLYLVCDCLNPPKTIRECSQIRKIGDLVLIECSPGFQSRHVNQGREFSRILISHVGANATGGLSTSMIDIYFLPEALAIDNRADYGVPEVANKKALGMGVLFETRDAAEEHLSRNRY